MYAFFFHKMELFHNAGRKNHLLLILDYTAYVFVLVNVLTIAIAATVLIVLLRIQSRFYQHARCFIVSRFQLLLN